MIKIKVLWVFLMLPFINGCNMVPPANADSSLPATAQPLFSFEVSPGIPAQVSLLETRVRVQTNNLPATRISSVNLPLLREWGRIYFKVNDYDRDGMNDLAILQSVGRVGTQRCYAIYRYNPVTRMFRQRKSFDRCGI